jgi:hypothetical protein
MKSKISLLIAALLSLAGLLFVLSCGSIAPYIGMGTTLLTSSTLTSPAARGLTATGTAGATGWEVSPDGLSGEVVSVFFVMQSGNDEGLVVLGNSRPDIASASSSSFFDLSVVSSFTQPVSYKPGFVGGYSNVIYMSFVYFDVSFLQNGTQRIARFWYADSPTSSPRKGDIQFLVDGEFKWYDTQSATICATRPTSPESSTFVRDYVDPTHPNMLVFVLGAKITSPEAGVQITGSLLANNSLTSSVDFDYGNALVFTGIGSEAEYDALTLEELWQVIDMKQNVVDWHDVEADPGLTCTATLSWTSK